MVQWAFGAVQRTHDEKLRLNHRKWALFLPLTFGFWIFWLPASFMASKPHFDGSFPDGIWTRSLGTSNIIVLEVFVLFRPFNEIFTMLNSERFLVVCELVWHKVSANLATTKILGQKEMKRMFGYSKFHLQKTQSRFLQNVEKVMQDFDAPCRKHKSGLD